MTLIFGDDFLEYTLDENTCHVHDDYKPKFVYNRDEWLREYNMIAASNNMTTDKKNTGSLFLCTTCRFVLL